MKILLRKTNGWESWLEVNEYGQEMKELHFFSQSDLEGYRSIYRLYIDKETCDNLVSALSQLKFE